MHTVLLFFICSRMRTDSLRSNLLNMINEYRKENNKEPLVEQESLEKAAKDQANFMCATNNLTHFGNPINNSKTLSERLLRHDYVGEKIGENIAKQKGDDYEDVFRIWKKSKEHNKNMLGDYDGIGIGTCKNDDDIRYWAHVFGKKGGNPHKKNDESNKTEKEENRGRNHENENKKNDDGDNPLNLDFAKKDNDKNKDLENQKIKNPEIERIKDLDNDRVIIVLNRKNDKKPQYETVSNVNFSTQVKLSDLVRSSTPIFSTEKDRFLISETKIPDVFSISHAKSQDLISSTDLPASIPIIEENKTSINTYLPKINSDILGKSQQPNQKRILTINFGQLNDPYKDYHSKEFQPTSIENLNIDKKHRTHGTANPEILSLIKDSFNQIKEDLLSTIKNDLYKSLLQSPYQTIPRTQSQSINYLTSIISYGSQSQSDVPLNSSSIENSSVSKNLTNYTGSIDTSLLKSSILPETFLSSVKSNTNLHTSTHPDITYSTSTNIVYQSQYSNPNQSISDNFKDLASKNSSSNISPSIITVTVTENSDSNKKENGQNTQIILADIVGKIHDYDLYNDISPSINIKDIDRSPQENEEVEATIHDLQKILCMRNMKDNNFNIFISPKECNENQIEIGESIHLGSQ